MASHAQQGGGSFQEADTSQVQNVRNAQYYYTDTYMMHTHTKDQEI